MRKRISSGSYFEPEIGFSRAVRVGNAISISGTAPIAANGGTEGVGVYEQTRRCLKIIEEALLESGATLNDVVRTRVMLTDISTWKEAARAHGEVFSEIRPACTFVEVSRFIDPDWLVELEADAVLDTLSQP
ncbi:MAG: RidA family protein [Xanthobacteraceae bacterium]